jgi:hypothetical protein
MGAEDVGGIYGKKRAMHGKIDISCYSLTA